MPKKPNVIAGDTSKIKVTEFAPTDKKVALTRTVPYANGGDLSREAMAAKQCLKPPSLDPEDIGTLIDYSKV